METTLTIEPAAPRSSPVALGAIAPLWHTLLLILLQLAQAFSGVVNAGRTSSHASRMVLYGATIAVQWITVAFIYYGLRRRGHSLGELVGGKWSRARDFFLDLGIAAVFWIGSLFVLGIASIALHLDRSHDAARAIAPKTGSEVLVWIALSATAGFCEETIFRGYLQRQFLAWTRHPATAIVLSALIFGAGHLYQSYKNAVVITLYGIMFGILAWKRGSLRPGIMTHVWHDAIFGILLRFLPK